MNGSLHRRTALRFTAVLLMSTTLGACNTLSRISDIGGGPKLSHIQNPVTRPNYQPVSLPMPAPQKIEDNPNSLWRSGAKAFFKDHRAKQVGDILTVSLDITDSASLSNITVGSRTDSENTGVPNLLGYETKLSKILPHAVDPSSLMSFSDSHATNGTGTINRSESISLTFAAVVTQVLPNGELVIMGHQEVKVNSELRQLVLTGVVRPDDIESDNTIDQTKIAEMRVAYGGRGTLSDLQEPRWGTQLWDIVFPF